MPDGPYYISNIQDYFEYILKKSSGKNRLSFNKNMHK